MHHKILAFKGQEGQERPSSFFGGKLREVNSLHVIFFKINDFAMDFCLAHLRRKKLEGLSWPSCPLKAKILEWKSIFGQNNHMI